MYENALRQDEVISNASPRMQRIRAAAGFLLGAALLACFLGADAGSQGFISVANGAFVDANCTEFIPVGWNSCDLSCLFLDALSWSVPYVSCITSANLLWHIPGTKICISLKE